MLPWPMMKAFRWRRRAGTPTAYSPEFAVPPDMPGQSGNPDARPGAPRLAVFDVNYDGLAEIRAFCQTIPTPIRQAVSVFHERHWQLLTWISSGGPAAEQLLNANPALAFAVACGADLIVREAPIRFLEKLPLMAYHGQLELLARLGFPATERVRRIMRKVVPPAVNLERVRKLRELLQDDNIVNRLAHTPALNDAVLTLLENGTFATVNNATLRQLACAKDDDANDVARRLAEAIQLWALVRPTTPLRQFNRVERIREVHAEVSHDATRVRRNVRTFPPPPVSGTSQIIHIDSMAMLVEESRLQSNCVDTYAQSIRNSTMAVYRVLAPQRCTLALRWRRGRWVIDELKGTANSAASTDTRDAVKNWLKNADPPPDVRDAFLARRSPQR